MQKITPFLWFNNQAEEAVNFYVSIFKNSKVLTRSTSRGSRRPMIWADAPGRQRDGA
jgi:predicted 3-demethylubiquinone-9 3-methyltransferase (glyoxalase superfamily)